jgi:hypothetical protein
MSNQATSSEANVSVNVDDPNSSAAVFADAADAALPKKRLINVIREESGTSDDSWKRIRLRLIYATDEGDKNAAAPVNTVNEFSAVSGTTATANAFDTQVATDATAVKEDRNAGEGSLAEGRAIAGKESGDEVTKKMKEEGKSRVKKIYDKYKKSKKATATNAVNQSNKPSDQKVD